MQKLGWALRVRSSSRLEPVILWLNPLAPRFELLHCNCIQFVSRAWSCLACGCCIRIVRPIPAPLVPDYISSIGLVVLFAFELPPLRSPRVISYSASVNQVALCRLPRLRPTLASMLLISALHSDRRLHAAKGNCDHVISWRQGSNRVDCEYQDELEIRPTSSVLDAFVWHCAQLRHLYSMSAGPEALCNSIVQPLP